MFQSIVQKNPKHFMDETNVLLPLISLGHITILSLLKMTQLNPPISGEQVYLCKNFGSDSSNSLRSGQEERHNHIWQVAREGRRGREERVGARLMKERRRLPRHITLANWAVSQINIRRGHGREKRLVKHRRRWVGGLHGTLLLSNTPPETHSRVQ